MATLDNVRRFRTAVLGLLLAGIFAFGSHLNASRLFVDCIADPGQCDGCEMGAVDCEDCAIFYLGGGDCIILGDGCAYFFCDCSSSGGRDCYPV
jgi:hypothetical protein